MGDSRRAGRRRLGGLLAALALAGAAAPAGPPLEGDFGRRYRVIAQPETAPDYAFREHGGREWGFVELRGRVILAMFWATWCPVCGREVPKLDRLQARLGQEGLVVIALAQDRGGPELVERWFAERGVRHLRVFHDPGSILARTVGIRGLPTTFVIDKAGRMVGVIEGPGAWDSPEAAALLRHYLAAPDPGASRAP